MSYSSPPPPPPSSQPSSHFTPPPPQYYTTTANPSMATPPSLPPKPTSHNTPIDTAFQHHAPPVPPPPRISSRAAPTWATQQGQTDGGWDEQYQPETQEGEYEHEYGYTQQQNHQQLQNQEPAMPQNGWVPEMLFEKSKPDLHHLISNPTLLTSLLHDPTHMPPVLAHSIEPLRAQLAANTVLAQHLTSLEHQLRQLRDTTSAHVLSTRGLEANWRKKQAAMEDKLEAWGPRELYNRLGAAIQEGEANCRAVEEGWIDDSRRTGLATEREIGEWIRRVREGRRVVVLRRQRRSRWDEGRVGGWR